MYVAGQTLADALPHLRETYCGPIAYEIEHIASHRQRLWLREAIESGKFRSPLATDEQKTLLRRLTEVDALERFMHKAYLGQKQFSIEGLDMTVPMLDELIQLAATRGAREVVIGMAHRGQAQRARAQPRPSVRLDLRRVRGLLDARADHHDPARRHRGRQVPPRRPGLVSAPERRVDHRPPRVEPVAPGVRGAGRGGRDAGGPDDAPGPARPPRDERRRAGDPPRRRRIPGPGRRRRDAQPPGDRRLHGRRDDPPHPEQPGRLHDRSGRLTLDSLGVGPGQGVRRADHPRQRRRRRRRVSARFAWRSRSARSSGTTC